MYEGTFFEAVAPILIAAQFFGVMPLHGVLSKSCMDLNFRWNSVRTVYSTICILGIGTLVLLNCVLLLKFGFDFERFTVLIFFLENFLGLIFFFNLARNWRVLMQNFCKVEAKLPPFRSNRLRVKMKCKFIIVAALVFFMSAGIYISDPR